jgi:hypothetical protein
MTNLTLEETIDRLLLLNEHQKQQEKMIAELEESKAKSVSLKDHTAALKKQKSEYDARLIEIQASVAEIVKISQGQVELLSNVLKIKENFIEYLLNELGLNSFEATIKMMGSGWKSPFDSEE